ncbi:MAG: helix-turn-helix domain-containing protein [Planctomycetota bacterium]|nr:helix-turn-helix domain-containing protein [Planctomycetota bacterium]
MSIADWEPTPAEAVSESRALRGVTLKSGSTKLESLTSAPLVQASNPAPHQLQKNASDAEVNGAGAIDSEDDRDTGDSEIDDSDTDLECVDRPIAIPKVLHRLAIVRQQQGVSHRNLARRLGSDIRTVRAQEHSDADLPLSLLYAWQQVLEVPISELMVDSASPLSPPVLERARMVRLMKTVAAMLESADSNSMKRMIQMLSEQLIEIMPELKGVGPWHAVGQRRTLDDYGRAAENSISEDFFRRLGS